MTTSNTVGLKLGWIGHRLWWTGKRFEWTGDNLRRCFVFVGGGGGVARARKKMVNRCCELRRRDS